MPTPPPSLTPPPSPPTTTDPANFDSRADALVAWLPTMVTQQTALAANVHANALEAEADATSAASSANSASTSASTAAANVAAAVATAQATADSAVAAATAAADAAVAALGSVLWVSGTNYGLGALVTSPINRLIYRRTLPGVGSTDPSLDPTNWAPLLDTSLSAELLYLVSL